MPNPWPEIRDRLDAKLTNAEEAVTSGRCRDYAHYRYWAGAINSMRDILEIARDVENPQPEPKPSAALELDGAFDDA